VSIFLTGIMYYSELQSADSARTSYIPWQVDFVPWNSALSIE
jgi:hypothetical protein